MYSEKGLCPHCGKKLPLKQRISDIDSVSRNFICRTCLRTYSKEEAQLNYQNEIDKLLSKAKEELLLKDDGQTSYKLFGNIVDIDNKIESAHYGRVLSLFFCSTLRKPMFSEVESLINSEKNEIYRKSLETSKYLSFLRILNASIDKYLRRCTKLLRFNKNYFYDEECLKVYLQRVNGCLSLKNIILEEVAFLSKGKEIIKGPVLKEAVEHSIDELNVLLNYSHAITTGERFHLDHIARNKEVLLAKEDKKAKVDYSRYRMSSLKKDKNKRYIKDKIFKREDSIYGRKTLYISLFISSLILFVGFVAVFLFFHENKPIFIGSLVGVGVFAICSIVFLILFRKYAKAINKRKNSLLNNSDY
ncbi:MAG: hypothetical protein MJ225_03855 [Bacilli bacterium]|nr:hypothetical protein [Bacilli bacterium]